MNREILKNILLIVLCVIIILMLIVKDKNKFVYVENEKKHYCQKCVIVDNEYYCQTSITKGSDK